MPTVALLGFIITLAIVIGAVRGFSKTLPYGNATIVMTHELSSESYYEEVFSLDRSECNRLAAASLTELQDEAAGFALLCTFAARDVPNIRKCDVIKVVFALPPVKGKIVRHEFTFEPDFVEGHLVGVKIVGATS